MAQQTAIEWFYQRILAQDIKEVFEQAKAMEKEQMYQVWKTSEEWSDGNLLDSKKSFIEYYNETYNK